MQLMVVFLATQLLLVFGFAGLFWPEKFVAVFEVLLYPWASNSRLVRLNSIGSLSFALTVVLALLFRAL
jgi:hypothetical protein